jgi:hypothetical protein
MPLFSGSKTESETLAKALCFGTNPQLSLDGLMLEMKKKRRRRRRKK